MLNKYFDLIICISLPDRQDRRAKFDEQAKRMGFTFFYFNAIKPEAGNEKVNRGNLGCMRSHKACLQIAKLLSAKRILILEDDCEFREELIPEFIKAMDKNPDYDLLFLGGSYWLINQGQGLNNYDEHFNTGTNILCTHSYSIRAEKIDDMIEILKQEIAPVDVRFIDFQNKNKTLIFKRNITVQRESYSDIQNRHANYDKVMRN